MRTGERGKKKRGQASFRQLRHLESRKRASIGSTHVGAVRKEACPLFFFPLLFSLLLLLTSTNAFAADTSRHTYKRDLRVLHTADALEAVRSANEETLASAHEYLGALSRGACSAQTERLTVECLITAAKRYCAKRPRAEAKSCPLYMDVAAANVLAENHLIPDDRRYQLMKRYRDAPHELSREVLRIQGGLAVDFRLQMGAETDAAALAKKIDTYCLAASDDTNLPYQTCAASLVWFIGTDGTGPGTTPRRKP